METSNKKRDMYCWVCHIDGPLLICKQCPRAYHPKCSKNVEDYPEPIFADSHNPRVIEVCPECQLANETFCINMTLIDEAKFKKIVQTITSNLRDGYVWPNPFHNLAETRDERYRDIVAKVMDIMTLEHMANNSKFSTLEGLLGEAKWMLHNTVIMEGRCSREAQWAKQIVDLCKFEINAANLCPECYLKEQDKSHDPLWFSKACRMFPHLIGWAKIPGFSVYWPVKIIQWKQSTVVVRAFANYRKFEVPIAHCYLFSEKPPKFDKGKKRSENAKRAAIEMNSHIQSLARVVGTVQLPYEAVPLKNFTSSENAMSFIYPEMKDVFKRKLPEKTNPETTMAQNIYSLSEMDQYSSY